MILKFISKQVAYKSNFLFFKLSKHYFGYDLGSELNLKSLEYQ